jgi:hypothetical protein
MRETRQVRFAGAEVDAVEPGFEEPWYSVNWPLIEPERRKP